MYPCNPLLQIADLKKSLLELKKIKINLFFPFQVFQTIYNLIILNKSKNVKSVKDIKKILF